MGSFPSEATEIVKLGLHSSVSSDKVHRCIDALAELVVFALVAIDKEGRKAIWIVSKLGAGLGVFI